MFFWLFVLIVILVSSSLGRGLVDLIAGEPSHGAPGLDAVEQRLTEQMWALEERLERAERVLQQHRASDGLPPLG